MKRECSAWSSVTAAGVLLLASTAHAASLQPVNGWSSGGLPSDVSMHVYVPDNVATNPPVLALIHYCGGTAGAVFGQAQGGGLVQAADQYGFIMVVPSSGRCWDIVSTKTRTRDGGGDSHAIKRMLTYALDEYDANPARVYATGDSSGGMMTELLLALYPDMFKAGAAFAGMPAACGAASNGGGYDGACAGGNVNHSPEEWGDIARMLAPAYTGRRPRVQLFHGDADSIIRYPNHTEAIEQWSNVLGVPLSGADTDMNVPLGTHQATRQRWTNACGYVVLDAFTSLGGDHGPSDALFPAQYVVPFLGLDKTGALDPEVEECESGSGGMGGAGGTAGAGGMAGSGGTPSAGAAGANNGGAGGTAAVAGTGGMLSSGGAGAGGASSGVSGGPMAIGGVSAAGSGSTAVAGAGSGGASTTTNPAPNASGCSLSGGASSPGRFGAAAWAFGVAAAAWARRRSIGAREPNARRRGSRRTQRSVGALGLVLLLALLAACSGSELGSTTPGAGTSGSSPGGSSAGGLPSVSGSSNGGGAPSTSGGAGRGGGVSAGGTSPLAGAAAVAGQGGSAGASTEGGAPAMNGGSGGSGGDTGLSGSAGMSGSAGAAGYDPCPTDGSPCLILPFGDSITNGVGSSDQAGYRSRLFQLIVEADQNAKFVGSLSGGPEQVAGAPFSKNHEGHSGWTIDSGYVSFGDGISTLVPMPAFTTVPHIVLLMIGTNDVSASMGANAIAQRLDSLLGKVVQAAPKALVVVAQITPIGWNPAARSTYNAAIPGIVAARAGQGQHLVLVDMGKMPASGLASDSLHPNDSGYGFMADAWYDVIQSYLD